jgi:hypothetical protein
MQILVLGDSKDKVAEMRASVGEDRLVSLPPERAELSNVQRAFFDLIIIRDAAVVVGGRSAFITLPTEMGHGRLYAVVPEGEPEAWLASFESEVLDPAGLPESARGVWRGFYRDAWDRLANYQKRAVASAQRGQPTESAAAETPAAENA